MKVKDTEVSAAELADWLGITPKSVTVHATAGTTVRTAKGRYLLKASVQAYATSLRASASGRGSPASTERIRLVAAQAVLAEQNLATKRGQRERSCKLVLLPTISR